MVGSWIPSGNDQQRLTNELRIAVQQLQQAAQRLQAISNTMAQMAPAADVTTIEQYFTIQAGSGQAVKDLIGSAATALSGNTFVQGVLQRLA
jgi:hypothetical protein